ncbi:MAG: hypothetical protein PHU56_00315 [Candidatus Pacebacteria bacterium]|nr:hypothetical protein [Candidatus Paceibacterota bacterium]
MNCCPAPEGCSIVSIPYRTSQCGANPDEPVPFPGRCDDHTKSYVCFDGSTVSYSYKEAYSLGTGDCPDPDDQCYCVSGSLGTCGGAYESGNCSDNIDNDGDGLIDCQDYSDCPNSCTSCQAASCSSATYDWTCTPITSCINGDGCCAQGCIPSTDSDCASLPCASDGSSCSTSEQCCSLQCSGSVCVAVENCSDNIDNNSNGLIDCQDPQCPSTCGLCGTPSCSPITHDWTCTPITSCINGDGCCPTGCTRTVDNDCPFLPCDINYCRTSLFKTETTQAGCTEYPSYYCSAHGGLFTLFSGQVSGVCYTGESCLCCGPYPPVIGYFKAQAPTGTIKLALISVSDALTKLKGMVKTYLGNGIFAAADLVETTDPSASPVRVMTPYGIKSWRRVR